MSVVSSLANRRGYSVSNLRGWGKAYKVRGVNGYVVEPDEHDVDAYVAYPMDDESDTTRVIVRRAFSGGDSFGSDDDGGGF